MKPVINLMHFDMHAANYSNSSLIGNWIDVGAVDVIRLG